MEAINITINGEVFKDPISGWTCVAWPDSQAALKTGRTVKVICRIEGLELPVTLMPTGNGHHMIPLKQDIRKKIQKDVGDIVEIQIVSRQ